MKNATLTCNGNFILKSKNENITNELNKLIEKNNIEDKLEVNDNDNNDNNDIIKNVTNQIKKLEKKINKKKKIYNDLVILNAKINDKKKKDDNN